MTPHTRYCSHYSSYSVTTTMHLHTQIHIHAHSTAPPPLPPRPRLHSIPNSQTIEALRAEVTRLEDLNSSQQEHSFPAASSGSSYMDLVRSWNLSNEDTVAGSPKSALMDGAEGVKTCNARLALLTTRLRLWLQGHATFWVRCSCVRWLVLVPPDVESKHIGQWCAWDEDPLKGEANAPVSARDLETAKPHILCHCVVCPAEGEAVTEPIMNILRSKQPIADSDAELRSTLHTATQAALSRWKNMSSDTAGAIDADLHDAEAQDAGARGDVPPCTDRAGCHGSLNKRKHCVPCRHFFKGQCNDILAQIQQSAKNQDVALSASAASTLGEFEEGRKKLANASHTVWRSWVPRLKGVALEYETQMVTSAASVGAGEGGATGGKHMLEGNIT